MQLDAGVVMLAAFVALAGGCESRHADPTAKPLEKRGAEVEEPRAPEEKNEPAGEATSEDTAPASSQKPIDVSVGGAQGVIFPFGTGGVELEDWKPPPARTPSEKWTPTAELVAEFEKGLKAHLRSNPPNGAPPGFHRRVGKYCRQYWSQGGGTHRTLHVQLLCPQICQRKNWRERILNLNDGGDCIADIDFIVETTAYGLAVIHGGA